MATGYQRASRRTPCRICGKPNWCSTTKDLNIAFCARTATNADRLSSKGISRVFESVSITRRWFSLVILQTLSSIFQPRFVKNATPHSRLFGVAAFPADPYRSVVWCQIRSHRLQNVCSRSLICLRSNASRAVLRLPLPPITHRRRDPGLKADLSHGPGLISF